MRTVIFFPPLIAAVTVCDAQWVHTNGPYVVLVNQYSPHTWRDNLH